MVKQQISEDGWGPCPKGTLTGLSVALKRRARWQQVQQASSLVAVLLLAVAAGTWFANRQPTHPEDYPYGGITCTEVRDSLPQMMSGKADESLATRIKAHLAECPRCAEMARRMKEQEMHAVVGRSSRNSDRRQSAVLLASGAP